MAMKGRWNMNGKIRLFGLSFDPKEAALAASVLVGVVCWFAAFWPVGVLLVLALSVMLTAEAPHEKKIADRSITKLGIVVSIIVLTAQIGTFVLLVRTLAQR